LDRRWAYGKLDRSEFVKVAPNTPFVIANAISPECLPENLTVHYITVSDNGGKAKHNLKYLFLKPWFTLCRLLTRKWRKQVKKIKYIHATANPHIAPIIVAKKSSMHPFIVPVRNRRYKLLFSVAELVANW